MRGFVRSLRRAAERLMPDEATIYQRTTQTTGGEQSESWSIRSIAPCSLAPLTRHESGETGVVGGRVADETTHLIRLPAETEVEEPDRIVVGDAAFDVTLVRKWGALEPVRSVEVKEAPMPGVG